MILDELEAAHAVYESAVSVFPDGMYGSRQIAGFASFLAWAQKILAALEEILTEGGRIAGIDFAQYRQFAALGDYHRSYKEFILKIPDLLADLACRLESRRQATRGLASRALAVELRRKGVAPDTAAEALAEVDPADEEAAARALVARRMRSMAGLDVTVQTRRLAGMLARKGYPSDMVLRVVREAVREAPEHQRD